MYLDDDLRVVHLLLSLAVRTIALQVGQGLLMRSATHKFVLAHLDRAKTLVFLIAILNEIAEFIDRLIVKAVSDCCIPDRCIIKRLFTLHGLLLVPVQARDRARRVFVDAAEDAPLRAPSPLQTRRLLLPYVSAIIVRADALLLIGCDRGLVLARRWRVLETALLSHVAQGYVSQACRRADR